MDIIENIKSVLRAASTIGDGFDKFNSRSVARGASEQSFMFPVIIDDTVPVEMAVTLARNLDRLYASWTQIYLSSVGFIDLNYVKNPKQFIAKYQPRFNFESAEENDYVEDGSAAELKDVLYGDDESFYTESFDKIGVSAYIGKADKVTSNMRTSQRNNMKPYLEGVNYKGLYTRKAYMEADEPSEMNNILDSISKANTTRENQELAKISKDVRAPRMGDVDIKKINDMQPYPLELKLLAGKGDSGFSQWINYIIGVKSVLHLGKSDVIEKNLIYVLKNKNALFNFVRWTTGEISLMKDIILHLDDINFDIVNKNDRTGKFISSMKRLKKKYVKAGTFGINRIAPMATIIISSSTYQSIKNGYGFDLKNITFAHKVMEELFLMSFVIIDDVTHTVDMLVDGQHNFQTYSLEMLEREVNMNSNKLSKELTRMLGSTM